MANSKLSKEEKKALKQRKKIERKEQFSQIGQAIKMQKKEDPQGVLLVIGAFVGIFALFIILGLFLDMVILFSILGFLLGVLAAIIIFGRRARKLAFGKAEGQVGAGAWVLDNFKTISGAWCITTGISATPQFDIVHRVIGLPGIILVGEGNPNRAKQLIAHEKRSLKKIASNAPVYEVIVGKEEGQVPVSKLQSYLQKLPKNISREQVHSLDRRLAAIKPRQQAPKGPVPQGAKVKGVNRSMKRK